MEDKLKQLYEQLNQLQSYLSNKSKKKFKRLNPFIEDLFDWKNRAKSWDKKCKDVTIYNSATIVGDVKIGQNSWIGPFCALDGTGGLSIGKFCSISTGVQIVTHDTVRWSLSGGFYSPDVKKTKVGNNCYIGSYAVITKGVTIGDYSVIGAGAVIVKNVMPYSIVAGVPGKKIGRVEINKDKNIRLIYDK